MITYTIKRRYANGRARQGERYDEYQSGIVGYNEAMLEALNELQAGWLFDNYYDQVQVFSINQFNRELLVATIYPPEGGLSRHAFA